MKSCKKLEQRVKFYSRIQCTVYSGADGGQKLWDVFLFEGGGPLAWEAGHAIFPLIPPAWGHDHRRDYHHLYPLHGHHHQQHHRHLNWHFQYPQHHDNAICFPMTREGDDTRLAVLQTAFAARNVFSVCNQACTLYKILLHISYPIYHHYPAVISKF